ncbi:hypothetical protein [Streptomyces sp. YKOK-I1]
MLANSLAMLQGFADVVGELNAEGTLLADLPVLVALPVTAVQATGGHLTAPARPCPG